MLFIFCLLCRQNINAQNFVINASFEDTILCPFNIDPKLKCAPWYNATNGSVDYWHSSLGLTNCTGAFGIAGYQQAKTGNAYCGLSVYDSGHFFPYREYLEGFLYDTLKEKHTYCVSFYVNLANTSMLAANSIGAYFSIDSIADYNNASLLPYIPQVQNSGGVITDTLNWVLVSGSFEAQGGERFITIGNFYADSNTTVVPVQGGIYNFAYYYIDDVSVVDCTVGLQEIVKNNMVNVWPNPAHNSIQLTCPFGITEITVFDVSGRIVIIQKKDAVSNTINVNVQNLKAGYYTVAIKTGKQTFINCNFVK